jgi:hypothetical protein
LPKQSENRAASMAAKINPTTHHTAKGGSKRRRVRRLNPQLNPQNEMSCATSATLAVPEVC